MTCPICEREGVALVGGICGHCSGRLSAEINDAIEPFVDDDLPIQDVGFFDYDDYLHVRLDPDAFDLEGERSADTIEDLHELPWSEVEGAYVRVLQECCEDVLDLAPGEQQDTWTEEREGELVGRANGTGLTYVSDHGNVPDSIGPAIYLDTPEDTILEVRTDKVETELLAFGAEHRGDEE